MNPRKDQPNARGDPKSERRRATAEIQHLKDELNRAEQSFLHLLDAIDSALWIAHGKWLKMQRDHNTKTRK